jgi:hypothetical protein
VFCLKIVLDIAHPATGSDFRCFRSLQTGHYSENSTLSRRLLRRTPDRFYQIPSPFAPPKKHRILENAISENRVATSLPNAKRGDKMPPPKSAFAIKMSLMTYRTRVCPE